MTRPRAFHPPKEPKREKKQLHAMKAQDDAPPQATSGDNYRPEKDSTMEGSAFDFSDIHQAIPKLEGERSADLTSGGTTADVPQTKQERRLIALKLKKSERRSQALENRKLSLAQDILTNFLSDGAEFSLPAFRDYITCNAVHYRQLYSETSGQQRKDHLDQKHRRIYSFIENILNTHDDWTQDQIEKELVQVDKCEGNRTYTYDHDVELTVRNTASIADSITKQGERRRVKEQLRKMRQSEDLMVRLFGKLDMERERLNMPRRRAPGRRSTNGIAARVTGDMKNDLANAPLPAPKKPKDGKPKWTKERKTAARAARREVKAGIEKAPGRPKKKKPGRASKGGTADAVMAVDESGGFSDNSSMVVHAPSSVEAMEL